MRHHSDPVAVRDELALIYAQSPVYQGRVAQALARIRKAVATYNRPIVAVSGGKDSMVCMYLAQVVTGGCPISFTDGELDLPETIGLMSIFVGDPDFVVSKGVSQRGDWFVPWSSKPYWRDPIPGAITRRVPVAEWLAGRGYNLTILGTRASESAKRRKWLTWAYLNPDSDGASYAVSTGTRRHCCPIWDWTDDDVFAFHAVNRARLPLNPVYDIYERIGVPRHKQRTEIMPLMPRQVLEDGWPDILERLEQRYGKRWR